jgi:putative sulfotransferase
LDRFIVGTGRCGSTLLSRMIAEHPRVLSIFEYFNGLSASRRFAAEPIGGIEFSAIVCAEQPFLTAVLRRGYEVPEVTYPFGPGARFARGDAVPWILVSLLPRLCDEPDALFDEVTVFAGKLPEQPFLAHTRALFAWLCARFSRPIWIERSGSSIDYLTALAEHFPRGRFLHIHRDGPEAALSMREHHAYRLPIAVMYDVPLASGRRVSELGPLDLHAAPRPDDPVSQILRSRPAAEYFGRYWSDQMVRGCAALPRLSRDRYSAIRFEDLVARPREALAGVADFFGLGREEGGWIERAAGLVRGAPPARFGGLTARERAALAEACRPGREGLARS